jgi:hypothetical protein
MAVDDELYAFSALLILDMNKVLDKVIQMISDPGLKERCDEKRIEIVEHYWNQLSSIVEENTTNSKDTPQIRDEGEHQALPSASL